MADSELVNMGFVKAAFGVKGWIKLSAQTEYADSLLDFDTWYLGKNNEFTAFTLSEGKVVPDGLVAKLAGIDDREAAHNLKGFTIAVPRSEFAPVEEGEYYWADLIGMQVSTLDNIILGQVVDLMQTGAHDVLVIHGEHGQKLIPFVGAYIHEVNTENKTILVDWGLDY
ncbi:ribosome maturation factor RimM [Neisseria sp. Ec49-e6-T10]|uniref:ribosome maturation factor RimM n=1 Tax=Neisseria sp. Ec49-e6-T10 TaxID=3140744 RepID=UPI003EB7ED14